MKPPSSNMNNLESSTAAELKYLTSHGELIEALQEPPPTPPSNVFDQKNARSNANCSAKN